MTFDELSNEKIVAYVLYELGGTHKKVHTEDIAFECFKVAKERFSWRNYKEHPDKEVARIALTDAAKRQLVTGRAGKEAKGKDIDGWILTPAGAKWVVQHKDRIAGLLKLPTKHVDRSEIDRVISRIKKEPPFNKYLKGMKVEKHEFTNMLRCSPDTSPEVVRNRFERLLSTATEAEDEDVLSFLSSLQEMFSQLMSP